MPSKYFHKTNIRNKLSFEDKPIDFDPIPGDEGLLKLDADNEIAGILAKAAELGRGGVRVITKAEYDDLKKNRNARGWGKQEVIDSQSMPPVNPAAPPSSKPKATGKPRSLSEAKGAAALAAAGVDTSAPAVEDSPEDPEAY